MRNVLWGVVCLDHYTATGAILPGCGILHNAYHLQQLGVAAQLATRLGAEDAAPVQRFLARNRIAVLEEGLLAPGACARIDVVVQPNGVARVTGFDPGVWAGYRLAPAEEQALRTADRLHVVLTGTVLPEFMRLGAAGGLAGPLVSADFLALHDFDLASFDTALAYVNIAFVGWPGEPDSPELAALGDCARARNVLAIFTLGERGVLCIEPGRAPQHIPVAPVAVTGSTNGCGDAFISYFLAAYWHDRDLPRAIAQGAQGGALATAWRYALPDGAYGGDRSAR
jgi:sugar/nucleoside kinase (ribokinase family)